MLANVTDEIGIRGVSTLLGMLVGGILGWFYGRWKRHRERVSIFAGDARDTVVIQQHIVASVADPSKPESRKATALRVRSVGQSQLDRVVPNGHLAAMFMARAFDVTPTKTLISMDGPEGSFLLETLTGFVGDRVGLGAFDHDLYVMAPCCEPQELSTHQPITILLIAVIDLLLFEHWPSCRDVQVEHGSDGCRVLTLMALARKFREEQTRIAKLRSEGKRTAHVETMYVLDLALDRRTANAPLKAVPWGRFEDVLKQMGLE